MKYSNAAKFAFSAAALGFLTLGLAPTSAFALGTTVTASPSMAVSATVVATCTISTTAMGFGNYTGVVANATATLAVTCTNTTPYTVALDKGQAAGGSVTARSMTGSAVLLGYTLSSDSGHSVNFVSTASINANGLNQPITVYGQIPAGEYVAPGTYTDTIVATVTY